MVIHLLAQQLERNKTCLAVRPSACCRDDGTLVHVGRDVQNVVTGVKDKVVDVQIANLDIINEIGEGDISLRDL